MMAAHEAQGGGTGSARRRRERRLRAYLRYARMSVAMALAETQHHSAQRPKKARAREEEREVHYTAAFRTTVPPPEPELFDLFEEPGAVRPNLLLEPQGPQDRDQLRTVEHTVGFVPLVQILDAPVPQTGEQLVSFFKFLDTQKPVVQVIAVPKITKDLIQPRLVDCDQRYPQMAEQLVEVPTIVSYSSLQRIMAQTVDIPVPGGGGRNAGLQGFPPEQSSTAALSSAERISERIVEQCFDIPVGGGLQDFRPGQSSSSVARSPAEWLNTEDEANQGVFRTFPQIKKKCDTTSALGFGTASALEPMDAGCL